VIILLKVENEVINAILMFMRFYIFSPLGFSLSFSIGDDFVN